MADIPPDHQRTDIQRTDIQRTDIQQTGAQPTGTVFSVLADPTRRRVLELLAEQPRRAGELAAAAGTSRSAMSNHLRVLVEHGFIEDGRLPEDARVRQFRLRPEALTAMQAWLDQLQMQWRHQLRSFKRHTERKLDD